MAAGAVTGAFLVRLGISWPVGLAGALLLAVAVALVLVRWRRARRRSH